MDRHAFRPTRLRGVALVALLAAALPVAVTGFSGGRPTTSAPDPGARTVSQLGASRVAATVAAREVAEAQMTAAASARAARAKAAAEAKARAAAAKARAAVSAHAAVRAQQAAKARAAALARARAAASRAAAARTTTVNARSAKAAARSTRAPASAGTRPTSKYSGRNRMWYPALGISYSVSWFPCSRSRPPDNYVYRWGCAGSNNVYLMAHAWGKFSRLNRAYYNGGLSRGQLRVYADGSGRVHYYRLPWWRTCPSLTSAY